MPCANCDFSDPCECQRKRQELVALTRDAGAALVCAVAPALPAGAPSGAAAYDAEIRALREHLDAAANTIAELLSACGAAGSVDREAMDAAEALLEKIRASR